MYNCVYIYIHKRSDISNPSTKPEFQSIFATINRFVTTPIITFSWNHRQREREIYHLVWIAAGKLGVAFVFTTPSRREREQRTWFALKARAFLSLCPLTEKEEGDQEEEHTPREMKSGEWWPGGWKGTKNRDTGNGSH